MNKKTPCIAISDAVTSFDLALEIDNMESVIAQPDGKCTLLRCRLIPINTRFPFPCLAHLCSHSRGISISMHTFVVQCRQHVARVCGCVQSAGGVVYSHVVCWEPSALWCSSQRSSTRLIAALCYHIICYLSSRLMYSVVVYVSAHDVPLVLGTCY